MDFSETGCGTINDEPMTVENKRKAAVINGSINCLSVSVDTNLKCMRDINAFLFAKEAVCEENKKEAKIGGWFDYIIDILATINNKTNRMRDELERLKAELKD